MAEPEDVPLARVEQAARLERPERPDGHRRGVAPDRLEDLPLRLGERDRAGEPRGGVQIEPHRAVVPGERHEPVVDALEYGVAGRREVGRAERGEEHALGREVERLEGPPVLVGERRPGSPPTLDRSRLAVGEREDGLPLRLPEAFHLLRPPQPAGCQVPQLRELPVRREPGTLGPLGLLERVLVPGAFDADRPERAPARLAAHGLEAGTHGIGCRWHGLGSRLSAAEKQEDRDREEPAHGSPPGMRVSVSFQANAVPRQERIPGPIGESDRRAGEPDRGWVRRASRACAGAMIPSAAVSRYER